MVWAMGGRMPLMTQSAPMSRTALTVCIRCWATAVSTVGTPVMSMMATSASCVLDGLEQVLHHHLGAGGVECADQGDRQTPAAQPTTGVDSSSNCWLCRRMISSRPSTNVSKESAPATSSSRFIRTS